MAPLFIDALFQFASVFGTEITVEKHFDPPKCDFCRGLGGLKNFLGSLSLAIFCGPLINYAVIRPLIAVYSCRLLTAQHTPCRIAAWQMYFDL